VEHDEFTWIKGEKFLTSFESQPGFGWKFCSRCGSTLCGTQGNLIHGVTLGCVNGNPPVEIGYHIFVGSKAAWEVMPAGVQTYMEGPPIAETEE